MMTLAEFEKMLDGEIYSDAAIAAAKAETRVSAEEIERRKAVVRTPEYKAQLAQAADPLPHVQHVVDASIAKHVWPEIEGDEGDSLVESMRGQLLPGTRKRFVLAGAAIFTLRSKATGTRFTYKVTQSDVEKCRPGQLPVYFVSLLNGSDNGSDYCYIGTIFADGFRITRKSRVAADAPSAVAFSWFAKHLEDARVEVWHEGRCGRCGRTLTVPESIASGLGPICAGK